MCDTQQIICRSSTDHSHLMIKTCQGKDNIPGLHDLARVVPGGAGGYIISKISRANDSWDWICTAQILQGYLRTAGWDLDGLFVDDLLYTVICLCCETFTFRLRAWSSRSPFATRGGGSSQSRAWSLPVFRSTPIRKACPRTWLFSSAEALSRENRHCGGGK